jgi:glycosyltransferase involved in cell wall biosynthesis
MNDNTRVMGMVLKGYPRISETFISNEIKLIEEQGIRVHIFSMRQPRESFTHKSVQAIKAGITYLPSELWLEFPRFIWPNLRSLFCFPSGYAKAVKLAFQRYRRNRNIMTVKHLLQAGFLVHHSRGKNIQHLHAHFAHSPTSVAMFAAEIAGLPFSFTAHAKDIYTTDKAQLAEKMARAKFVVTCTQYNKRYLDALSTDAKQAHCVYHGIDLRLFSFPDRPRRPAAPYSFLTIARFVEKKGLGDILAAMAILKTERFPFHYTLIGDGDERPAVIARIQELDLEDEVTLTGTLPHEQVLQHFQRADCFVLGCKIAQNGDRDGIPNVLAESMALGVPVVVPPISGIPELVEHERTGVLVDTTDAPLLASALKRIITDEPLRQQLLPAAQQRIHEIFDNRRLSRTLVACYREFAQL